MESSPQDSLTHIQIHNDSKMASKLTKDLYFYYRTLEMEDPILLAQKSTDNPNEIACIFSFVPSFNDHALEN